MEVQNTKQKILQTKKNHPLPPGPSGFMQNMRMMLELKQDFIEPMRELANEYGDIASFKLGAQRMIFVNHPKYVKHLFVDNFSNYIKGKEFKKTELLLGNGVFTANGSDWKKQRRMIQPFFSKNKLRSYFDHTVNAANEMLTRWDKYYEEGKTFDLTAEMMKVTLAVLTKAIFQEDMDDDLEKIEEAMNDFQDLGEILLNPLAVPLAVPTPLNLKLKRAAKTLTEVVSKYITKHEGSEVDPGSLLSLMVHQRDEQGNKLSFKQIRDQIVTLLVGGHETASLTMTWIFLLLFRHQEDYKKLIDENELAFSCQSLNFENLRSLEFNKMVVEEGMRLFPAVWGISREAVEDDIIDGYLIPKGTTVLIYPFLLHRREQFFFDAESFLPERFSMNNKKEITPYSYIPFGAGPRLCTGADLAVMEMQVILSVVSSKYKVHIQNTNSVWAKPQFTLRPSETIHAKLERVK